MIFDKGSVLSLMKAGMSSGEKKNVALQELALAAALDDLSLRLKSQNFLTSYTESVSANTREVTLEGSNQDMRGIFALKWGTGESQKILNHIPPEQFLRDYDNPSASAGTPTIYTILTASDSGWPVAKFNVPNEKTDTLTIYYYLEITPDSISMANSQAAAVAGGLAYFHQTGSELGQAYYAQFRELAALTKAQSPTPHVDKAFTLTGEDRDIRRTVNAIRLRRT